MTTELLLLLFGTGILGFLVFYILSNRSGKNSQEESKKEVPEPKPVVKKPAPKLEKIARPKVVKEVTPVHPNLVVHLKGQSPKYKVNSIVWDPSNHYIVSLVEDRTIRLFMMECLSTNDHKQYKITIEGDEPACATMSPDGKYLVVGLKESHKLQVYGILPKKNKDTGKAFQLLREYPKSQHGDLVNLQMTSDSKAILACYKDTTVLLWDTKGNLISKLQTKQLRYTMASLSPDGNMLALATSMSDIKLYPVEWNSSKDGSNRTITGIGSTHFGQLIGHSSGINCVTFIPGAKRCVTSSRDGTWKIWDIEGDYKRGFQPKAISTFDHPNGKQNSFSLHAVSPDGKTLAAVSGYELFLFDMGTGAVIVSVKESAPITDLSWSPTSDRIVISGENGLSAIYKK